MSTRTSSNLIYDQTCLAGGGRRRNAPRCDNNDVCVELRSIAEPDPSAGVPLDLTARLDLDFAFNNLPAGSSVYSAS